MSYVSLPSSSNVAPVTGVVMPGALPVTGACATPSTPATFLDMLIASNPAAVLAEPALLRRQDDAGAGNVLPVAASDTDDAERDGTALDARLTWLSPPAPIDLATGSDRPMAVDPAGAVRGASATMAILPAASNRPVVDPPMVRAAPPTVRAIGPRFGAAPAQSLEYLVANNSAGPLSAAPAPASASPPAVHVDHPERPRFGAAPAPSVARTVANLADPVVSAPAPAAAADRYLSDASLRDAAVTTDPVPPSASASKRVVAIVADAVVPPSMSMPVAVVTTASDPVDPWFAGAPVPITATTTTTTTAAVLPLSRPMAMRAAAATIAPAVPLPPLPPALAKPIAATPSATATVSVARVLLDRPVNGDRGDREADPASILVPLAPADAVRAPIAIADLAQKSLDMAHHDWPQRMIDRIEVLRDQADVNDASIRLKPAALGSIDVAIHRHADGVSVQFTAERAATRMLLADARPELAAAAEARGIRLSQAGVDPGNMGAGGDRHPAPPVPAPAPAGRPIPAVGTDEEAQSPAMTDGRIA
ncbi:flagellar hook-length control protein FliK [uncultured Sphingomonas sp.]|uniref:flagellar hook-length control protein FliK n=1 Tax=uncultured Sphingomonas sp. TaxID=158754 RepID=UPI0035CC38A2